VLAAGSSSRFGTPKQLVEFAGETFVGRAARLALESGVQRVVVVTGAAAEEVVAALEPLKLQAGSRLQVRHNPRWAEGQSTSLGAGMDAMEGDAEAALFLPVDQPYLESSLLRRLIQAWRMGASLAAPIVDGELRGAPALFDRIHFEELQQITGDRGGRELLRLHALLVHGVPAAAHSLLDVDSPKSWNREAA
jgi:CTP:molybdopterin cytidylyltransferase MocA